MALHRCPPCKGRGHNGIKHLAVVGDFFHHCKLCDGSGRIKTAVLKAHSSSVEAVFLLKDGSFFEMVLNRSVAQSIVIVSTSENPDGFPCTLHHIDVDGVFHYEEEAS
jgi:hypothetical protein